MQESIYLIVLKPFELYENLNISNKEKYGVILVISKSSFQTLLFKLIY